MVPASHQIYVYIYIKSICEVEEKHVRCVTPLFLGSGNPRNFTPHHLTSSGRSCEKARVARTHLRMKP